MLETGRLWLPILLLSLIWAFLSQAAQKDLSLLAYAPPDEVSNILLLTAHPDDECMFFAPTLLGLLDGSGSYPRPNVHSICLSVGNADGLGGVRRRELERSLDVLGIEERHRWVVDRPDLQDNFTAEWDPRTIADVLRPYVLDHRIHTILTFDHHGISSHPNHISLPKGAAHLVSTLPEPRPRVFSLVTVPLYSKYLGPVAPLTAKLALTVAGRVEKASTTTPVAVSDWRAYARALRAMTQHWSQLVWFRWLYVAFSRYMWVNEWVEVVP
ncbi:LmbE-like protein [Trametes polyzona]|nr:LmbE-like protein [Trametes polyzona]